jgi:hypothetical protein
MFAGDVMPGGTRVTLLVVQLLQLVVVSCCTSGEAQPGHGLGTPLLCGLVACDEGVRRQSILQERVSRIEETRSYRRRPSRSINER